MRVLIGCEESAKVRDAFIALGHDAWSCDIVRSRGNNDRHLQIDVKKAICHYGPWDIIILHPDCTAMAVSGNGTYGFNKDGSIKPLSYKRQEAINWTVGLWVLAKKSARIGCAIENPVSVIWPYIGKPQYIQPWQFGHGETKTTGILVYNLPPLKPTNIVAGREHRIWKMPPGPNRKRDRSETYPGIADAMAAQWSLHTLKT